MSKSFQFSHWGRKRNKLVKSESKILNISRKKDGNGHRVLLLLSSSCKLQPSRQFGVWSDYCQDWKQQGETRSLLSSSMMNSQSARLTWSNWSLYSGTPHNTQTWNAENLILGLTDIIRQLNSHYWWDECIEGLTFRRRKIPPVSGFIYSYDYRWQDPPCRNFDFFLFFRLRFDILLFW